MGDRQSFARLVATVDLIARHPDYPGKQRVVDQCLDDIGALARAGRISADQAEVLREILLGACPQMA